MLLETFQFCAFLPRFSQMRKMEKFSTCSSVSWKFNSSFRNEHGIMIIKPATIFLLRHFTHSSSIRQQLFTLRTSNLVVFFLSFPLRTSYKSSHPEQWNFSRVVTILPEPWANNNKPSKFRMARRILFFNILFTFIIYFRFYSCNFSFN